MKDFSGKRCSYSKIEGCAGGGRCQRHEQHVGRHGDDQRMHDLGAVPTSTYGILFELFPDLSTPQGRRAQAVASDFAKVP